MQLSFLVSVSITTFPFPQETIDVDLDRPEHGGFGLLIARDKNLPPPALFVNDVTPDGIAAKTGLMDKGESVFMYWALGVLRIYH